PPGKAGSPPIAGGPRGVWKRHREMPRTSCGSSHQGDQNKARGSLRWDNHHLPATEHVAWHHQELRSPTRRSLAGPSGPLGLGVVVTAVKSVCAVSTPCCTPRPARRAKAADGRAPECRTL